MNLPEPSGSSPALKPPGIISICERRMRRASSALEASMSAAERLQKTKVSATAPGLGEGAGGVVLVVRAGKGGDQRPRPGDGAAAAPRRPLAEQGALVAGVRRQGALLRPGGKDLLQRLLPMRLQPGDVELQPVDADDGLGERLAQEAKSRPGEELRDILAFRHFQQQRADGRGEQFRRGLLVGEGEAQAVAEAHLADRLRQPAGVQRPGGQQLALAGQVVDPRAVLLEGREVGHLPVVARQRQQHHPAPRPLEFGREDAARVDQRHGEGDQGRRHVQVPEGARHAVLAADGRDAQPALGAEGPQQGGERQAPAPRVAAGLGEILLQAQAGAARCRRRRPPGAPAASTTA